jgi:hypothetical protein
MMGDMKRRQFITLLGGAAAWPSTARAQSGVKSHRVSFLALVPREDATLMKALLERLHELGYSEGTNLIFEYRSAEGRPDRLAQLAMELVQAKPDVLVAGSGPSRRRQRRQQPRLSRSYSRRLAILWVQVLSQISVGPAEMSRVLPTRRGMFKASACNFFWS